MDLSWLTKKEYPEWDEFVDHSPQGTIYCYSWWLKNLSGNDIKIAIIRDKGEILAGIPLPYYSTKKIHLTPLTQTIGILFHNMEIFRLSKRLEREKEYTNCLLDFIEPNINEYSMQFCNNYTYWLPFYWRGYSQTTRYSYVIDYSGKTIDDIWANVSESHRRNIKKAKKSGVKIQQIQDIKGFYKLNKKIFVHQNMKIPYSFEFLKKVDAVLNKQRKRTIMGAFDNSGTLIAASYFIHNDKTAYYLMGGGIPEERRNGSQLLTLWTGIEYFIDKCGSFDFEGSMIENIEFNFRKFGADPKPYFLIHNIKPSVFKRSMAGFLERFK